MNTAIQAAASLGADLASTLIAIIATLALLRWALRPRACPRCGGTGTVPGLLTRRPCSRCNG